jgi:hypothetical protein
MIMNHNDNPSHPVQTNIIIGTATFEDDSRIPGTNYGKLIPVKIVSEATDGDARTITVMIGGNKFPLDQIEYIMKSVARHKKAVTAWNVA